MVILDFWTHCCINCLHVLPELEAVERRFRGEPVKVIGVHAARFPAEQERDRVADAVERHHIHHPVVLDPEHRLWEEYAIKSWPTVLVLDVDGRIAWRQPGEVERHTLMDLVGELIDEAREDHALAAFQLEEDTSGLPMTSHASALRHPGKVHVSPGAAAQQVGSPVLDEDTRLYIADTGHHRILECTLVAGEDGWPVSRFLRTLGTGLPGFADGDAEVAAFREPQGMDATGTTLYVADTGNHAVRAVDLETGAVHTVAGTGELGRGGRADPRQPRSFPLRSPWDIAIASEGTGAASPQGDLVFIAMAGTHQVFVYLPSQGRLQPVAGSGVEDHVDGPATKGALAQPSGLELFGRYLFIADSEVSSVRAFDLVEHTLGTVVGRGLFDFGDVDGPNAEARLQHPLCLTAADHTVYVCDTYNDKIKAVDLAKNTTRTLAGGPGEGTFEEPAGIARAGDFLVVADTNAHRIRVVHRETGEVRTLEITGL